MFATAPAPTLPVFLGNIAASSADASNVTTATLDTTGADFLIIYVASYQVTTAPTISDSKGNTWTPLTAKTQSGLQRGQLYYTVPSSVGSGHTFSANGSLSYPSVCVQAFSTVNATPFDTETGAVSAGSVSSLQPGSITPTEDYSLLVSGYAPYIGEGTVSIDSSFAITDALPIVPGFAFGSFMAYKIQGTSTADNPTWTCTGSSAAVAVMASFKPA